MIYVVGPKDRVRPRGSTLVDVTSHSKTWSQELSPFYVGPIPLYDEATAYLMENAWQFCKLYKEYTDTNENPTPAYWQWASDGWLSRRPQRYPRGKGERPLYSLWDGERFDYVTARKRIYIPLYGNAVVDTSAYRQLLKMAQTQDLSLFDFDGYNHHELGMSLRDVVNCEERKMGHAFVLAFLLEQELNKESLRASDTPA